VPPRGPQRPGQVVTSAVLAFVQAAVVLIASLYLWFFASIIDIAAEGNPGVYSSSRVNALATEGTVMAVVQLVSVVLLIAAGIRALSARTRTAWLLTVGAHAVQIVLAVYWAVRLTTLMDETPGPDASGALAAVTIFFAAAPLVGLGMVLAGPGRRWFESPQQR
jgi:magnesium-transporting ATPase (P-type)